MGDFLSLPDRSEMLGDAALGAVKVANAVAHKQAAYDMELAKHATRAAMEMEETRRLVEKYVLGDDVTTITDVEPSAGFVEGGGPPNYSAFPYPMGSEEWPTNYPVAEPPTLDRFGMLPNEGFHQDSTGIATASVDPFLVAVAAAARCDPMAIPHMLRPPLAKTKNYVGFL
eukprot:TRINITY_DN95274_c0_g1_i1.p2 TRINITY_DN95274_c0_g1~~TRINITY_DN95274_c0_g1_i1.p2  ORF type:complete len:171 (+),score=34.51 TRINITY_DN95274_c0_g1_i1:114-626(+)